jgi:AcrR family transcriptional regulator
LQFFKFVRLQSKHIVLRIFPMSGEPGPRAGKAREELDRRLINVARHILEHEGLEALTLRAAARAAGVSHMAPYRHFENKEELLAAVAEEGFQAMTFALENSAKDGASSQARLDALGLTYISFALTNPALYRLMFGADLASRARFPGLVAAGNAAFAHCVEAMREHTSETEKERSVTRKAKAYWALVHGISSLAIDGLIVLPPKGDSAHNREIEAVLRAVEF